MAFRVPSGKFNEIGVFAKLTSTYCIVSEFESRKLYSALKRELPKNFPVVETSLAQCNVIGRMCVGNINGLLLPSSTSDLELEHLRNALPGSVEIQRVDNLSALGNLIACNDHVALVHPGIDKETREIIQDILQVYVYPLGVAGDLLIGTYCVLTNQGGLVHAKVPFSHLIKLSSIVRVPLVAGTVNNRRRDISSGMIVNNHCAFVGTETTDGELELIKDLFWLHGHGATSPSANFTMNL